MNIFKRKIYLLCLILIGLFISGCVSIESYKDKKYAYALTLYNSPNFADGYVDGSMSAELDTYTKNTSRYINDEIYKKGWDEGYARSKHEMEKQARAREASNALNQSLENIANGL